MSQSLGSPPDQEIISFHMFVHAWHVHSGGGVWLKTLLSIGSLTRSMCLAGVVMEELRFDSQCDPLGF